jgi:hypothetical protein
MLGSFLLAHRVIWAIVYGEWPEQVDHINGNRADNRIANLRAATSASNSRNMARSRLNSSGVSGVRWNRVEQRWHVVICAAANQRKFIGQFKTFEDAVAARKEAEQQFGYHPNHGRENVSAA